MSQLKDVIKNLPILGKWVRKFNTYRTRVPAGHYYSPIVSVKDVKRREQQIYPLLNNRLEGLDLAEEEQIALFSCCLNRYYQDLSFSDDVDSKGRYFYNNKYFGHADATSLYFIIRHFNPKKIIEVGSGFSSAVMLDVNERFCNNAIELSFIEPYPDRLRSLLKEFERKSANILVSNLQDIDVKYFEQLEKMIYCLSILPMFRKQEVMSIICYLTFFQILKVVLSSTFMIYFILLNTRKNG